MTNTKEIQPGELRVNNWLLNYNDKPVKVTIDNIREIYFHMENYSGVPLSEDILLKCGFEKFEGKLVIKIPTDSGIRELWWHTGELALIEDRGSETECCFLWIQKLRGKMQVHNLQNIYRELVGKELEITL